MKIKTGLFVSAVVAAAVVALYPARSEAGYNFGAYPSYCYKYADGSGYCAASFAGMRASSDPSAYAGISGYFNASNAGGSFFASLNGSYYSCYVSSTAPILARWLDFSFTAGNAPWVVFWDASGNCTGATVNSLSLYQ